MTFERRGVRRVNPYRLYRNESTVLKHTKVQYEQFRLYSCLNKNIVWRIQTVLIQLLSCLRE